MAHLVRSLADSARWIDARVGIGQLRSITLRLEHGVNPINRVFFHFSSLFPILESKFIFLIFTEFWKKTRKSVFCDSSLFPFLESKLP